MAVGHSILVIVWYLLTEDCDYRDLGGDAASPSAGDPASGYSRPTVPAAITPCTQASGPGDSRTPNRCVTG